jgi:hypothetical protein
MNKNTEFSLSDWRTASKRSWLRWPAGFSLAACLVLIANLSLRGNNGLRFGPISLDFRDALCMASCIIFSTLPVWYFVTDRSIRNETIPLKIQASTSALLLVIAALASPQFKIEYRNYDIHSDTERRDITITWIKRSIMATIQAPRWNLDELAWLQHDAGEDYIPAEVFCPRRSTRLWPMFGTIRDENVANSLYSDGLKPPSSALETAIARCRTEGEAMLLAGHTKESALRQGDIEGFFERNAQEIYATHSIMLSESKFPKAIRERVETFLAQHPQDGFFYIDNFNDVGVPGTHRRFRTLVVAAALQRPTEVERLRAR